MDWTKNYESLIYTSLGYDKEDAKLMQARLDSFREDQRKLKKTKPKKPPIEVAQSGRGRSIVLDGDI